MLTKIGALPMYSSNPEEIINYIYKRNHERFQWYCKKYMNNPSYMDDCIQDAYIRMLKILKDGYVVYDILSFVRFSWGVLKVQIKKYNSGRWYKGQSIQNKTTYSDEIENLNLADDAGDNLEDKKIQFYDTQIKRLSKDEKLLLSTYLKSECAATKTASVLKTSIIAVRCSIKVVIEKIRHKASDELAEVISINMENASRKITPRAEALTITEAFRIAAKVANCKAETMERYYVMVVNKIDSASSAMRCIYISDFDMLKCHSLFSLISGISEKVKRKMIATICQLAEKLVESKIISSNFFKEAYHQMFDVKNQNHLSFDDKIKFVHELLDKGITREELLIEVKKFNQSDATNNLLLKTATSLYVVSGGKIGDAISRNELYELRVKKATSIYKKCRTDEEKKKVWKKFQAALDINERQAKDLMYKLNKTQTLKVA